MSSAAQFIVFREKRKMVRREILHEKTLTKKIREKSAKNEQNWPNFDVRIGLLLLKLLNFNQMRLKITSQLDFENFNQEIP